MLTGFICLLAVITIYIVINKSNKSNNTDPNLYDIRRQLEGELNRLKSERDIVESAELKDYYNLSINDVRNQLEYVQTQINQS